MKASIALALGIAALLAVTGTAGYVVLVNHGQLVPSSGTSAGNEGTLRVYVKDAPADWSHLYVTFTEVRVHAANAGDESGWKNVTTTPKTVDLKSTVAVSELLGSAKVPAGMYTQLRLNVTKAWGVMTDGVRVNFTVPSGELRTDHPFNLTAGQSTSLTLDIDLSRSIVEADGHWLFTPVVGSVEVS